MKYRIKVEHIPTGRLWYGNSEDLTPKEVQKMKSHLMPRHTDYAYVMDLGEQGQHTWRGKAFEELCISIEPSEPPKAYAVNLPDGTLAGIALSWDEAVDMARQLYIDRIEVEDAIEVLEVGKIFYGKNED